MKYLHLYENFLIELKKYQSGKISILTDISQLPKVGVPVNELLVNKPKTEQEKYEQELLGRQNTSLEWFIKLPYEYKSKYIELAGLLIIFDSCNFNSSV